MVQLYIKEKSGWFMAMQKDILAMQKGCSDK